jgi:thymidine kinase
MSLQIYLGPMFAGKSSTIIRIVNRYKSINKDICLVSHTSDVRYTKTEHITNHDQLMSPCERWARLMDFVKDSEFMKNKTIIIDEAQFFPDLYEFILLAVDKFGKDIILFGLDGDADRKPFGQLLDCIPLADEIIKLKAFCKVCADGTDAIFTYCIAKKSEQVCIGGSETYMPLCRKHYCEMSGRRP